MGLKNYASLFDAPLSSFTAASSLVISLTATTE